MNDITCGVIVIGRNEGEMLKISLLSLPSVENVVYVDSGSTDGSVELAESLGFLVHSLDPSIPFSAARARREGVDILNAQSSELDYIQFVDADCELDPLWISTGIDYFERNDDTAIVCGKLIERHPEASIYNWLSSLQWNGPVGEINACGGIFMIRNNIYKDVGGFNSALLTREEKDLCDRVIKRGKKIVRIDSLMAKHDSGLLLFGQWWKRAVWGGYGDALQISLQGKTLSKEFRNRIRRYLLWPLIIPVLGLLGVLFSFIKTWMLILTFVCFILYGGLFFKLFRYRIRMEDSFKTALLYSVFKIIRKFASGYGFALFFLQQRNKKNRPDPHEG